MSNDNPTITVNTNFKDLIATAGDDAERLQMILTFAGFWSDITSSIIAGATLAEVESILDLN